MNKEKPKVFSVEEKWLDYFEAVNYMMEKYPDIWTKDFERYLWDDLGNYFCITNGRDIDQDEMLDYLQPYLWPYDDVEEENFPDDYDKMKPALLLLHEEFGDKETEEFPGFIISW